MEGSGKFARAACVRDSFDTAANYTAEEFPSPKRPYPITESCGRGRMAYCSQQAYLCSAASQMVLATRLDKGWKENKTKEARS